MADEIQVEILPDGSIKITTDQVSSANHRNADELMKFLAQQMGGDVDTTKNRRARVSPRHRRHA